jgi:hypothetical protein
LISESNLYSNRPTEKYQTPGAKIHKLYGSKEISVSKVGDEETVTNMTLPMLKNGIINSINASVSSPHN